MSIVEKITRRSAKRLTYFALLVLALVIAPNPKGGHTTERFSTLGGIAHADVPSCGGVDTTGGGGGGCACGSSGADSCGSACGDGGGGACG